MTRTEKLAMELRVLTIYIIIVSLTLKCFSKPVWMGTATLSKVELSHAVEYLKRYGYIDGVKNSSSEGGNGITKLDNKTQVADSTSTFCAYTTEKKDSLKDVRPPESFMNVMAYTENDISKAIKNLQKMHGVKQTGTLNKNTTELVGAPCSQLPNKVGDVFVKTHLREEGSAPRGNKRPRRALSKKSLITYKIVSSGKRLTQTEVQATIKRAFRKWAEVIPIVFRSSSSNADISIDFHDNGSHGCSITPPFDGKGGVIAHVLYPTPQYGGQIHFDDDENWSAVAPTSTQISLMRAAMHMGGHMLQLGHSTVANAIMNAIYLGSTVVQTELQDDDIQMAQRIYGLCETSFDAIESWMGNGKTYTFKNDKYWRFNDVKRRTEPNYPQPTTLWRGIPQDIDEMLLWGHNWGTYFFKGDKYYKYNDNADAVHHINYISRGWRGVPDNIDAAFTHSDWKTYFFKGNLVYQFDNIADRVSSGYPKHISAVFPGVPDNLDTAFRWYHDGNSYFFKGLYFYEWSHTSRSAGRPQRIALKWQNHCFV